MIYVEGNNQITFGDDLTEGGNYSFSGDKNEVLTVTREYGAIYIAPGAVLSKRVVMDGKFQKIYGRGIILDPYSNIGTSNLNNVPTAASGQTVLFKEGQDAKLLDVKILNSANYNVKFTGSNGFANHVKLLSTEMSSDGFTTTGYDYNLSDELGVIENCFVYVGDNALVIQNDTSSAGYSFKNITIGTTCAAIYPQWRANTTLEDIYVFRADDGLINVYEDDVHTMTVNITNLDALDCVYTPSLFHENGGAGSDAKVFNLTNVTMRSTTENSIQVNASGFTLNLNNLYVNGSKITASSQLSKAGTLTVNVNNIATEPTHTAVPAGETANYTYTGSAVYGAAEDWTRYQSYKCILTKSGTTYTVKKTTGDETSTWGLSKDITDQVRQNGTGSYQLKLENLTGTAVNVYIAKCSATGRTVTKIVDGTRVITGSNKTVDFTVDDLNAVYQIVIKSNSDSATAFAITNPTVTKK